MELMTKPAGEGRVTTLAGSPADITDGLRELAPDSFRVVAVTVPTRESGFAREVESAVVNIASMVETIVGRKSHESFQQIVEALVRPVVPTATALVEARMLASAKNAVLQSKDYVTAKEIAEIAGYSGSNPSAQPNRWKQARQIFAIHHSNTDYFPFFGLDAANGYKPYPVLAEILAIFGEKKGPWGAAFWFEAVNSYLGGATPKSLLGTDPERVVMAAKREVAPVAHG